MSIIRDQISRPLTIKSLQFEVTISWDQYKHLTVDQIESIRIQIASLHDTFAQDIDRVITSCVKIENEALGLTYCPLLVVS